MITPIKIKKWIKPISKKCKACQQELPVSAFNRDARLNYLPRCKPCDLDYRRSKYAKKIIRNAIDK